MWVSLNTGFLSVVQLNEDPRLLLVRARRRIDLERIFGASVKMEETPERDYRWRTVVDRAALKRVLAAYIDGIDYPNFKNSTKDEDLHDLYLDMWHAHNRYQRRDPETPAKS